MTESGLEAREAYPQQPLLRSILLHLVPGLMITGAFLLLRPTVVAVGFPPLFAFLLAVLFIGIPLELGWLIFLGYRENARLSLGGVVLYRESVPVWQYFLILPLAFLLVILFILLVVSPLNRFLLTTLLPWLPEWFILSDPDQYTPISRQAIWITFVSRLLVAGLAFPVVEELYFRGYLLPRLTRFRAAAPVLGAFLYALYQFWAPYEFLLLFGLGLIVTTLVWWKKNIWFGISLHLLVSFFLAMSSMLLFFVYP